MCSLRHILGITRTDRVPNTEFLTHAENQSIFTILMQRLHRWLGHVHGIADGKIPKDLATH